MADQKVYVNALSILHSSGIRTLDSLSPWENDQHGPQDIRRKQVLDTPYIAFGKLSFPDRLAFSAASLALRDCPLKSPDSAGLFCSIPCGSLSTDLLYRRSVADGAPSPALFSATLPSSAIADVAIYHHIKGPNAVFAGGDNAFSSALEYALLNLRHGTLSEAVVIHVSEVIPSSPPPETGTSPCSAAMILTTVPADVSRQVTFSLEKTDGADKTAPSESETVELLVYALEKNSMVRFPVSHGRFIGYISLHPAERNINGRTDARS